MQTCSGSGPRDKEEAPSVAPAGGAPGRVWWAAIILVALVMRGLYWHDYSRSPLFDQAVGPDVEEYYRAAHRVLAGQWLWDEATVHGPLYSYVLAGWCRLSGDALPVVRALQLLLGMVGGIVLTLAVARRCGSLPAMCTGVLWALYRPAIHYEAELISEGLAAFLNACVLALLLPARSVGIGRAALAGLLLGLAAITHAAALVFAILVLLWLAFGSARVSAGRAAATVVAALAGLALPTLPVMIHSARLAGRFAGLQETGGLNFYIGNNAAADGTPNMRPGPEWDGLLARAYVEGRLRECDAHSGFFYDRALDFITAQPGDWSRLMLRKAALSISAWEITASAPAAALRTDIRLLRWPMADFGILLALVLAGLAVAGGFRLPVAGLLILAFVLSQVLYVAAGRYRLPMMPGMFVLGGLGLAQLVLLVRARAWRRLGRGVAALVPALAVAFLPIVPGHNDDPAEGALLRAVAWQRRDDLARAEQEARAALALRPDYGLGLVTLGQMLEKQGRLADGVECYRRAVAAHPGYARAHLCLAEALLRQSGELTTARPHYVQALALNPEDGRVRFLYGRALLIWEHWADAAEQFRFILSRRWDPDACAALGESLARLGQYAEAAARLEQAAPALPNNVRLLAALTRLRAACPDEHLRDARRALELGQRAAVLSGFANLAALDALGMALASAGEFPQAAEAAAAAARLADRRGDTRLRAEILARRELYLRQTPYRDPPPR